MGLFGEITEKPWEHRGVLDGALSSEDTLPDASRIALYFFLMVVTALFLLFGFAYFLRMELADWRPLPEPNLLWFNTLVLVFASVALQWTTGVVSQSRSNLVLLGLLLSGVFTAAFLVGQVYAWQLLIDQGYYLSSNPANSFFYLITGLHGLHVLGGMFVWAWVMFNMVRGVEVSEVLTSLKLCATYWHFLLLLWIVLFYSLLST